MNDDPRMATLNFIVGLIIIFSGHFLNTALVAGIGLGAIYWRLADIEEAVTGGDQQ